MRRQLLHSFRSFRVFGVVAAVAVSMTAGPAAADVLPIPPAATVAAVAGTPSAAGAVVVVSLTPARIADSRVNQQITGAVPALGTATVQVTGQGGVPAANVAAVVLNVTVVSPQSAGYITVWPFGIDKTNTSNLNFHAGQNIPNTVIVPVGTGGKIQLFVGSPGATDVIIDVNGYTSAGSSDHGTLGYAADCVISRAIGSTASAQFPPTGATANDSTDDTTAIQAAINRAGNAGGGVVLLPAGTFILNGHLVLKSGVNLSGTGPGTVLKAGPQFLSSTGPAGGYPVVTTAGASDVTIANLTADQSGDTLNGNLPARLDEYLIDVRNSSNALVMGVQTKNPFTYSIVAVGADHFCITGSGTYSATQGRYDQLDGIHILNASFGDVVNNNIDQGAGGPTGDGDDALVAHTLGGTVHDIRYANNKARSGQRGDGMQFALTDSTDAIYNITLSRNEFYGSPGGIVTGLYGSGKDALVHDVSITGNFFHDNANNAVSMTGHLWNIGVTNNNACRSNGFAVGPGNGNIMTNNIVAKSC